MAVGRPSSRTARQRLVDEPIHQHKQVVRHHQSGNVKLLLIAVQKALNDLNAAGC
jgi:hypothetical protein